MPFKHKLARRLALLRKTALIVVPAVVGCADVPTDALTDLDLPDAASVPIDASAGERVRTTRWVRVFSAEWSHAYGKQPPGMTGTVVGGPVITRNHRSFNIDFDYGADGWVFAAFLEKVGTPTVASVTISPDVVSTALGGTAQLAAVVRDAAGNAVASAPVTWSTGNASVATVSSTGLVRGVGAGTTAVFAASGGPADTAAVSVTAAPPAPVASVTVTPATASMTVGGTTQLTATLRDDAGTVLSGRAISWTTSNGAVATVSASGVVSGVAAGAATITATSEGRSDAAAVAVTTTPPPPPVDSTPLAGVLLGPTDFSTDWSGMNRFPDDNPPNANVWSRTNELGRWTAKQRITQGQTGDTERMFRTPTFPGQDHLFARWRVYYTGEFTYQGSSYQKYFSFWTSAPFSKDGGLLTNGGPIRTTWYDAGLAQFTLDIPGLPTGHPTLNVWHTWEVEFWKNGCPFTANGWPAFRIWYDGQPVGHRGVLPAEYTALADGWYQINGRGNSSQITWAGFLEQIGSEGQTGDIGVHVADIVVSTRRIGP